MVNASTAVQYNFLDMSQRQKRYYSPQQLRGLRVVGTILKNIRKTTPNYASLGKFSAFLEERSGARFARSAIDRYEKAGLVTDGRYGVINDINPRYLNAIAPFSPFQVKWLERICIGDFEFVTGITLKRLINDRKKKLGSRWETELEKWGVDQSTIDQARQGIIVRSSELNLAGLLGIPLDQLQKAAIAQILEQLPESDEKL